MQDVPSPELYARRLDKGKARAEPDTRGCEESRSRNVGARPLLAWGQRTFADAESGSSRAQPVPFTANPAAPAQVEWDVDLTGDSSDEEDNVSMLLRVASADTTSAGTACPSAQCDWTPRISSYSRSSSSHQAFQIALSGSSPSA